MYQSWLRECFDLPHLACPWYKSFEGNKWQECVIVLIFHLFDIALGLKVVLEKSNFIGLKDHLGLFFAVLIWFPNLKSFSVCSFKWRFPCCFVTNVWMIRMVISCI